MKRIKNLFLKLYYSFCWLILNHPSFCLFFLSLFMSLFMNSLCVESSISKEEFVQYKNLIHDLVTEFNKTKREPFNLPPFYLTSLDIQEILLISNNEIDVRENVDYFLNMKARVQSHPRDAFFDFYYRLTPYQQNVVLSLSLVMIILVSGGLLISHFG